MADDEDLDFSFGDFKFASPHQSHINGVTSTSKNDDVWSDFFLASLPPKSSSSYSQSQFNSSINGLFPSNSTQPSFGLSSVRVDSTPIKAQKPNGALPLSLFGEVEDEDEGSKNNNSNGDLNGWFDPNPSSQNGKFSEDHKKIDSLIKSKSGFGFDFNGAPSHLIVDDKSSNKNNINGNNIDEDNEWEFTAAFPSNGKVDQGDLKGGVVVNGSNVEPLPMMNQEKQTGQGASNSVDHKPGSISFLPQSTDLFAAPLGNGANHQSSEMDVGFMSSTSTTNGFTWDPFPVVENFGNENGTSASLINEDDDFGDFVDASQVVSKDQEPVVALAQVNLAATQLQNGEVQEKQTQTGHSRGALPLSLFGDDTEESDDSLNMQNEVVQMPTLSTGNSFSGQSSAISIQDLISNLYSQAHPTSTDSMGKSSENGVQSTSQVTAELSLDEDEDEDEDEDWDDGSWEFKGAISQNVVGEQLSTAIPENITQKQPVILLELQSYTEFYDQLRDSLCILLSCQLEELKESQSSLAVTCNGENSEALDDEIQEAFKLLEEVVISKEVLSKDFERYNCLNKLVEVLQGTKLNVIESDFSLSKRLQLATSDWRVAAELLRHAILMKKVQSLGSADEQSIYASIWFKNINVCVQELRYGALLWKRASEEDVQHQIMSDSRGQLYIQALGEIYKAVALLGLSAKVYKPWILQSLSISSQIFAILKECDTLWSNSGLEEAIQKLSDNATFGCSETAKAAIASIKNIRDIDALPVLDRVFNQHKSLCRLSLLPQEMIADLKTVMWGEEAYFLNLANLWANLISCNPPQLPHLELKVE